jgi:hypothetical protein
VLRFSISIGCLPERRSIITTLVSLVLQREPLVLYIDFSWTSTANSLSQKGLRDAKVATECRVRRRLQSRDRSEEQMAKYGEASKKSVKSAVHREKAGTLRSGKGGKGGPVKSRKQAIAIGLSEARKKGAKVPRKSSSSK